MFSSFCACLGGAGCPHMILSCCPVLGFSDPLICYQHFGQMECLKLIAGHSFPEKRIGEDASETQ